MGSNVECTIHVRKLFLKKSLNVDLGRVLDDLLDGVLQLVVGSLAAGVDLLALLLAGDAADGSGQVEFGSALGHIDVSVGAEHGGHGLFQLIHLIPGNDGAGVGLADEALGAVVLVVNAGLSKHGVNFDLIINGAAPTSAAIRTPAASASSASTTTQGTANDGALDDGGLQEQKSAEEDGLGLDIGDADGQNGQGKEEGLHANKNRG